MDPVQLLIIWLVTAVSLLIISYLPIGVEIDGFPKALLSALVFGIVNVLVRPVLNVLFAIPNFLTFGLFSFVVNAIVFGLVAYLVQGFRLRWGIWSALIGAIALAIVNSLIYKVLGIIK